MSKLARLPDAVLTHLDDLWDDLPWLGRFVFFVALPAFIAFLIVVGLVFL